MWEIWAQWENGNVEMIDEADDETDAFNMITEYTMAYGSSANRIWKQKA